MNIIFQETWMLFIAVTVINAVILFFRSREYIEDRPELRIGYSKFILGLLVFGNIPWVIAGLGNITGSTESIFEYLNPHEFNPFVIAFHASMVVLWLLSIFWIYFKSGAEFIESHPGLLQARGLTGSRDITASQMKLFMPLVLLGGLIGMLSMWSIEIPIPNF